MEGLPLDRIRTDGGMMSIFRHIGCIGDSLSSGEFEVDIDKDGECGYWDCYEYSWGKIIERITGIEMTNFSRGGMTAHKLYCEADRQNSVTENINRLFAEENTKQAYIVALGVNDLNYIDMDCYNGQIGNPKTDIQADYRKNAHTLVGWYARIIQRLQENEPDAKFFLITIPNDGSGKEALSVFAEAVCGIAEQLDNCYVIDLFRHAPHYDDEFRRSYFNGGHMNAMGYTLSAHYIMTYIDWIIKNNPNEFRYVQFIGSGKKPYLYE